MKEYIGDGLYAEYDGFGVIVTSEHGTSVLNMVYFEHQTLLALNEYYKRVIRQAMLKAATPAPSGDQERPR